jgi:hypothetical protein
MSREIKERTDYGIPAERKRATVRGFRRSAQTLRGEAESEPFTAPSLGMTVEAVRIFVGAITLIDVQDVKPGIKIIKVEGHMPGEPGYALH